MVGSRDSSGLNRSLRIGFPTLRLMHVTRRSKCINSKGWSRGGGVALVCDMTFHVGADSNPLDHSTEVEDETLSESCGKRHTGPLV